MVIIFFSSFFEATFTSFLMVPFQQTFDMFFPRSYTIEKWYKIFSCYLFGVSTIFKKILNHVPTNREESLFTVSALCYVEKREGLYHASHFCIPTLIWPCPQILTPLKRVKGLLHQTITTTHHTARKFRTFPIQNWFPSSLHSLFYCGVNVEAPRLSNAYNSIEWGIVAEFGN